MRGVHGLSRVVVSVAAVVAAMGLCVPSAVAVDSPGYWYVDDAGVRDAWAQGVTGEGVKVAVVDDQAVSDYPGFAGVDAEYKAVIEHGDSCTASAGLNGSQLQGTRTMSAGDAGRRAGDGGIYTTHGTNMMAFIVGNGQGYDGNPGVLGSSPKASVTSYAVGFSTAGIMGGIAVPCVTKDDKAISINKTIGTAAMAGARIVNVSMGGQMTGLDVSSHLEAIRHGVIVVSARENGPTQGALDLVGKPATIDKFPGQVVVNAVDNKGDIASTSDVMDGNVSILSPGVDVLRYDKTGDKAPEVSSGGTSAATAILAGYLTLVMSKWPEATGNQVLQSLVRNTKGNDSGEARLDPEHKRGFGEVDLRKLLAVDPSQYPDINPILQWQVETSEKHEETRGMYTDHSSWTHDYGETDPFDGDDGERPIEVPKEAELVGRELDRQVKAWKKVEQCRADGGSDCMRYSATNTADAADEMTPLPDTGSDGGSSGSWATPPSWLWWAVGGGVAVLVVVSGGVVLAVVASRRRRRGRHGGDGNGHGPAAPPMPPMPPVQSLPPVASVPPVAPVAGVRPPVPQAYPVPPSFVSYGDGGLRTAGPSMGSPVVPGSPQAGPVSAANPPYASRSVYPPVDAASVVSPDHAQQSMVDEMPVRSGVVRGGGAYVG